MAAAIDARISKADVATLVCILDRIGDDGTAWPGLSTIAKDSRTDRSTAVRSVARLVSLGYIERESGSRTTSNRYRMGPLGRCDAAPRCESAPRCDAAPGVGATVRLGVGAALHPEPTHMNLPIEPEEHRSRSKIARKRATTGDDKKRGQRLPMDWKPDDVLTQWTRKEVPELDLDRELDRFRDYWRAKAGAAGVKSDWIATWRNWIRRIADDRKRGSKPAQSRPSAHVARGPSLSDAERMNAEAERVLARIERRGQA
jgi:hypothetical protein